MEEPTSQGALNLTEHFKKKKKQSELQHSVCLIFSPNSPVKSSEDAFPVFYICPINQDLLRFLKFRLPPVLIWRINLLRGDADSHNQVQRELSLTTAG